MPREHVGLHLVLCRVRGAERRCAALPVQVEQHPLLAQLLLDEDRLLCTLAHSHMVSCRSAHAAGGRVAQNFKLADCLAKH